MLLDQAATAEEHLAEAITVADQWQATVWRADACRALATMRRLRRP